MKLLLWQLIIGAVLFVPVDCIRSFSEDRVLAIVRVDGVAGEFMLWNLSGDGSDVHVSYRPASNARWHYVGGNAPAYVESITVETSAGDRVNLRQTWDSSWSGALLESARVPPAVPAPSSSTVDASNGARSR